MLSFCLKPGAAPPGCGTAVRVKDVIVAHAKGQPMILAVAADIAVQLEVAPLGRQMRAKCPDMAGGAGLAGLNRESRHGERLPRSQGCGQQQQDREPRTAKYDGRRSPAIGARSRRNRGLKTPRSVSRNQVRKCLSQAAFRKSISSNQ